MLIQLWANYGDTIKQRVFSPQVVGAGCFDEDGEHGKMFGMQFHKWINSTLHINMTKPETLGPATDAYSVLLSAQSTSDPYVHCVGSSQTLLLE